MGNRSSKNKVFNYGCILSLKKINTINLVSTTLTISTNFKVMKINGKSTVIFNEESRMKPYIVSISDVLRIDNILDYEDILYLQISPHDRYH
jgi:hypothetical protein